jgi:hypothetical protein
MVSLGPAVGFKHEEVGASLERETIRMSVSIHQYQSMEDSFVSTG